MAIGACTEEDCDRPQHGPRRRKHNHEFGAKRSSGANREYTGPRRRGGLCGVPACGRRSVARGFCKRHYQQLRTGRDPMAPEVPRTRRGCSVLGCVEPHDAKGFCKIHYKRWVRSGFTDPLHVTPEAIRAERQRASILRNPALQPAKTTYRKHHQKHEHRVVAAAAVGISVDALGSHEIAHHKDRDKHNNSPENIELTTRSRHIDEHRAELIEGRRKALIASGLARLIEIDGRKQFTSDWARERGIPRATIKSRLYRDWPPALAVLAPSGMNLARARTQFSEYLTEAKPASPPERAQKAHSTSPGEGCPGSNRSASSEMASEIAPVSRTTSSATS